MNRIIITLAAIAFISWNATAKIVDRIVAQVNDDIITLSDLNRETAAIRQQLTTQYSGERLEQEIKSAEKSALENIINEKLLLQKANELGFSANTDIQVSAAIERIRKEYNIKDLQEFERILNQQGQSMAGFREQIRRQIITRSLVDSFVGSRITILATEIEKYYKEHAAEFSTTEEVTLSEIVIPADANGAESEARANEIHKRLQQGEPFATLASQYSKGPTAGKGGSIGSYTSNKLNPEIARAIRDVKEGEITTVLKTKEGFVVYRVDSRKESKLMPLEEVKPEIQRRLWEQKFNPEYERFIAQLKEEAYIALFTAENK